MKQYHIVYTLNNSNVQTVMTRYPMCHKDCMVMISKQSTNSLRLGRYEVKEV
jgi:hypothetical protein